MSDNQIETQTAANFYTQNAAQNPVFLEQDDKAHQPVMPFDDFVIAAMKDTGYSREEVIAFASEAFRGQYQAADGYLRGAIDGSTMYNAFDIEMDDKTYYATAPLEWAKEQARMGLSDRGYALEVARHNFLHSSLDEWETAFHQLKAAADDYQQWRNQVCAFFNFRQPEIRLQEDEWTQVAQFVNYNQEWEQLDNARLMIAEFTPQQAYEFLGVYQQYQRYVRLAIHNAEQGIDTPELNTQIAAIKQSLNEKVAQNLPPTENRQVMFDLFGTQLDLFNEETQEQGISASENRQPESQNTDSVRTLPNNAADWVAYSNATGKMPDFSVFPQQQADDFNKLYQINLAAGQVGVHQVDFNWFLRGVSDNIYADTLGGGLKKCSAAATGKYGWTTEEFAAKYGMAIHQFRAIERFEPNPFSGFETINIDNLKQYVKGDFFKALEVKTVEQGTTTPENTQAEKDTVIASEQSERGNLQTTENGENLSGSLKDLQDELAWQNLYVVQFNNQRIHKKDYDHLTGQQVIDKDNELFEKEVQAKIRAAELMNEITQIVIGDEYANAKVPFANVVVQRDDRLLSYIKKVPFDFENKPNSLDERRLALRHSMQIVFENAMDRMSENHLFVENFIDTSRATHYLSDLIDKNVIKSKDELFNHIVPIFNSAEFVKNQESVEYQQWQKAIKNSLTSFSFKTKNEVIEQIERYGVSDKFVAEKRQIGVRKENYYWVAIEKQGTTTPEISANEVQQDLSGQPEKTTSSVLTKEEKAQLKAAKAALTAAKKELKGLRDEFDSKQGYSYFNTQQAEDNIVQKQVEVAELQRNYDNLYLALYGKTGELTNLEKEILSARNLFQSALFQGDDETLLKSLFGRIEIIERELKEQLNEIRGQHAELKQRQNDKQVFEFEIQSVMQDALAYFERNPHKKLYHNNQPLPLETDRDKAIAYVLKGTMVEELNGLVSQENSIIRKLRAFQKVYLSRPNDKMFLPQEVKFHNTLETAENQLMKGSIEDRAEINLTYDINTPEGEKKVRELFYGSRHDEAQAELFERVFAMAQKLGVEVRHALRDSGENKEINKTVLGQYSLDKNSARVKHNGYIKPEQKGEVLLHELIHSVTSRAMFLKEQGHTDLLNNAQIQAIDEIEKIYKLVTEKAEELGVKGDYGLTNSHEMIAELANPVFRDKLKQIGVFDDTVGKITEVSTGVSHTETAYDRLNKALYQIMDNYEPDFGEKWQQAKYSNIKMNDIFRQPEQPQEQTMKSSQEVLAEVMNKYEKHIDSKDGLMNKPLHWLSAAELEDRRTVLASRIDSAIQNDDHETEKRLNLEYIKVENERERRENLSGNLKEQTAEQGGICSPENSADEIKHDIFTQAEKDTIFEFDNGYTVVIADKLEQQVRKQGEFVEVRDCGFVWHKDAKKPVAQFDYEKKRGEIVPYSRIFFSSDFRDNNRIEVDVLNNSNWKNDLVEEMVDFAVRREHITKLNAELDNSWNYKLVSVTQGVVGKNHPNKGGIFSPETKLGESPNAVKQDAFGLPEKENQMEQTTQTAEKGGIFMAEPVLAGKTAQEMKEIINDLLQQRSEQMGNKHLSSDIATLMVYVQTDNPTTEETQAVKDLGVVKNFVENNMQYQKWYAPTPQDEIRRLSENTVKHDMNGLPEKPVHIDLDTPYIVAFPDDIEPNDPNANKTLGELMKQNDAVMWDAEFWGDRVGTGEMTVSENFIAQVIATQRSEVLEEILTCGNVPFTKEHIEALYEREPELIQEVANDYNEPKIKALAKEVVETFGLPETAPMTEQEIFSDWEKALNHYADMDELAQDANWSVDIYGLAELHKNEPALREKIEQLWTACNYHSEVPLLQTEKYEVFEFDKNTPKFTLDEIQALGDGVRLNQADEKVKNAEWERAKNPSDKERHDNLQDAIAMRDMLKSEIKESVQEAMQNGKPYIVEYTEDSKPLELVVTQNGNLKMALGSYEKEPNHNYLLSTGNGEVALNAEQRSTPERVAEVLKYNFKHGCIDIGDKLALISYPDGDKVFSEQEIKDTLNKALRSSFKEDQLAAIKSPVMRGEWLSQIADNPKATKELRQAAKNEMTEKYGKSKPQGQAEKQLLKLTAANGGVLSAPQQHTTQQPVVAKQVMQPQTTVKSHRMRH